MYEALENEKGIVQIPFPQFNLSCDTANKKVNISIECTMVATPEGSQAQARRIANRLYEGLVKRLQMRGMGNIDNPFRVTLLPKGSLKEPYFIGT